MTNTSTSISAFSLSVTAIFPSYCFLLKTGIVWFLCIPPMFPIVPYTSLKSVSSRIVLHQSLQFFLLLHRCVMRGCEGQNHKTRRRNDDVTWNVNPCMYTISPILVSASNKIYTPYFTRKYIKIFKWMFSDSISVPQKVIVGRPTLFNNQFPIIHVAFIVLWVYNELSLVPFQ